MLVTDSFRICLLLAVCWPYSPLYAESLQTGDVNYYSGGMYRHKLYKSRAERGYTANGTAIYVAPEIDHYHDGLSDKELGNVTLDKRSRVRRVYISPIVHDSIDSSESSLKIGTLQVNQPGSVDDVEINVSVEGDVRGNDIEIGTMELNGGEAGDVHLNTTIQGDVESW